MNKLRKEQKIKWTGKKDLEFQVLDWQGLDVLTEPDSDSEGEDEGGYQPKEFKYTIRLFGVTKEGYSVCMSVTDFKPYFFISLPDKWKKTQVQLLLNSIRERLIKYNVTIPDFKIVKRHKFRGFTNNALQRFAKLEFVNKRSMNRFKDMFYSEINILGKKRKFDLYEAKMDPLLRFIHINDIKAAGWVKIEKKKYEVNFEPISKCQIDAVTDWKEVHPVHENDSISPLIIASFDIEADSSHGDFPLAKKTYTKLATDILVHYWNCQNTIQKYKDVTNQRTIWRKFMKHKLEEEEIKRKRKILGDTKANVKVNISKALIETKTDSFIKAKENDVINMRKLLKNEDEYFYNLIASAFGLVESIEGISPIFTKKSQVPKEKHIRSIIKDIRYIAQFKQSKIKGDNNLKNGVREVVTRMENCNGIKQVEYVINDVARKRYLNRNHLQTKVLIKDVLVGFIDDIMSKVFPAVKGDRVIQIGTVVQKYGDPDIFMKHIITLRGCEDIDGAIVVPCKTEREVLMEWYDFINKLDPDIITGYNIFGFDEIFLHDRSTELGCMQQFARLGRIIEEEPKLIEKKLSSAALGDNTLRYIEMTGRVQVDVFKVVQRDYNLNSYKLDFVANHFIRGDVSQIGTYSKNMKLKTKLLKNYDNIEDNTSNYIEVDNIKDLIVGNFIYLNPKDKVEQSLDGKKYKIKDIVKATYELIDDDGNLEEITKNGLILDSPIDMKLLSDGKYFWGLAKDDVHHTDIFKLQHGSDADRKRIAVYCIQDCALLIHLINKLCIVTNNLGMANVCNVPFSYIFLRGQGIKLFSFVGKQCRKENYLVPDLIKESELEEKLSRINTNKYDRLKKILKENNVETDNSDNTYHQLDNDGYYHIGYEEDNVQKGFMVKDNDDGYEGAIVIKPHPDIYFEPVSVTDYGSLYPSSMISENLSHDSIVFDAKYDNLPGYDYLDVTYEIKKVLDTGLKSAPKVTVGYKTCRFAQFPKGEKGIIPKILMQLLKARKSTRAKIKTEPDKFKQAILDGLQLAYKVTANSLYGQIGARTSPIYLKDIAASTTATGRRLLLYARHFAEKNIKGCKCVYGDSIPGDEPILFKQNDKIHIETIEEIGYKYDWFDYSQFKPDNNDLSNKHQAITKDMYVYVQDNWVKVKRLIRHNTVKKIYRVLMDTGCVDVTEDHSLIDNNGNMIKPEQCIENETRVTESYPINISLNALKLTNIVEKIYSSEELTPQQAMNFVYGMFYGDGDCDIYNTKYGINYTWAINNKDTNLLNKCIECLKHSPIKNTSFKILDILKSSSYKIVPKGFIKETVLLFRKFYNKDNNKVIPEEILNDTDENIKYFLVGYYASDGYKCFNTHDKNIKISNKWKIGTSQLFYLLRRLGYSVSINTQDNKDKTYSLTCSVQNCNKTKSETVSNIIKKIKYIRDTKPDEYVYDIETECGWFTAGIGGMTLKNTDSIFVKFTDDKGNKLEGIEGLQESINKGTLIEKSIQMYFKKPHKLEYEKTFWPFILFTKKRYVGHKYETDVTKYKQNSMGIVLKRRDNAPIVKHVFGGVINNIMIEKDIAKSVRFLKKTLKDLLDGKFDVNNLIISKTLKGYYKDPDSIAHKVLADRMAERDPGNKPQTNDRIPFVYVDVPEREGMLQGEKIEHIDYVKEHQMAPNYLHYITNQIMKPVSQIYELIVEKLDGYNKGPNYYQNKYLRLLDKFDGDELKASKKISDFKKKEVQRLIFDDIINEFINKKSGYGNIKDLFCNNSVDDDNDDMDIDDVWGDDFEIKSGKDKKPKKSKKPKKVNETQTQTSEPINFETYDNIVKKICTEKMDEVKVNKTMSLDSFLSKFQ